jgi:hypothetical protein
MCPTSTWFGRITFFAGIITLLFSHSTTFTILGYLLIASAFIYNAFFAESSCSVDPGEEKEQKLQSEE